MREKYDKLHSQIPNDRQLQYLLETALNVE